MTSMYLYNCKIQQDWSICKPLLRTNQRSTRSSCKPIYKLDDNRPISMPSLPLVPATIINDPLLDLAATNYFPSGFPQSVQNPLPVASTLYEKITLRPFYKRLLGSISHLLASIDSSLSAAISQHDLQVCTDGSYNPSTSKDAHGWVLATSTSIIWDGAGPSDGHPQLMTPYRAELSGLVAGLHILNSLCQINNLSAGLIHMYCDCEKAVKKITNNSYKGISDHLESDNNLLREARLLYKNLPVKISLQWVWPLLWRPSDNRPKT